jgi:hypothetical protein
MAVPVGRRWGHALAAGVWSGARVIAECRVRTPPAVAVDHKAQAVSASCGRGGRRARRTTPLPLVRVRRAQPARRVRPGAGCPRRSGRCVRDSRRRTHAAARHRGGRQRAPAPEACDRRQLAPALAVRPRKGRPLMPRSIARIPGIPRIHGRPWVALVVALVALMQHVQRRGRVWRRQVVAGVVVVARSRLVRAHTVAARIWVSTVRVKGLRGPRRRRDKGATALRRAVGCVMVRMRMGVRVRVRRVRGDWDRHA